MVLATPIPRFLAKLAAQLWPEETETQARFAQALLSPQPLATGLAWCRPRPEVLPFPVLPPLRWQPDWVDRVCPDLQPGRHPLHNRGYYYCLDMSSVFAGAVLGAISIPHPVVIDLCAAPGGKSVLAWRHLQPSLLIANEPIGKRVRTLLSNWRRCRIPGVVLQQDPATLAQHLAHTADVVIVDAPCSGQSLLAKGAKNPGCFHPRTIRFNRQRQRRILAWAMQLLKPGGYLAYMTCTYSLEENEENAQWLLRQDPHLVPVPVPALSEAQSHLAAFPCYRLWPHGGEGAGAFTALWQWQTTGPGNPLDWEWVQQAAVSRRPMQINCNEPDVGETGHDKVEEGSPDGNGDERSPDDFSAADESPEGGGGHVLE
ncbi:MAG: RsmB/NOP family class I SAM-dependent RNA methyltransferase [Gloeomargarita sp. SKYBB_i_bin120]|nr:RsmB/NOP family class I SAM-dependent RNA methyltransferase [Gloeomargarita sp. SKYG98]MCS7291353.1 RsmB/NOP family class I SAM-dependent RNA methyltransferase [Gloeomargarita sp. SKYB120]MDW8176912.1 RsmB/NOP family class I SAM-dependent RNA methyltransferase [Gloeomargarita sp. SKYBB_i_bin120]